MDERTSTWSTAWRTSRLRPRLPPPRPLLPRLARPRRPPCPTPCRSRWASCREPCDPQGCTTPRGKLIFAAGIALLTWIIRTWGSYPDGVACAVLIANAFVPLIDRYTVPRIHGHRGR